LIVREDAVELTTLMIHPLESPKLLTSRHIFGVRWRPLGQTERGGTGLGSHRTNPSRSFESRKSVMAKPFPSSRILEAGKTRCTGATESSDSIDPLRRIHSAATDIRTVRDREA
jgi:hypothetical protein